MAATIEDVKERAILFSGSMVKAILAGTKTQTRRVMKPQPVDGYSPEDQARWYTPGVVDRWGELQPADYDVFGVSTYDGEQGWVCPYGAPGDLLYVRETWYCPKQLGGTYHREKRLYRADEGPLRDYPGVKWKPAIHMPREFSRILLEITDVRVERVNQISEADAEAEGVDKVSVLESGDGATGLLLDGYRANFAALWQKLNGPRGYGWDVNPLCWVVSFKRVDPA